MEPQISKMQNDLVRLKRYAGVLTLLFVITGLFAFTNSGLSRFKEISAASINIEGDGKLRMFIANKHCW